MSNESQGAPNATAVEIIFPDDFHHHLRDGDDLKEATIFAAQSFERVIAMPNLQPPVRNLADALNYRDRIMSHVPSGISFCPMMTLYLTDSTTPEDIWAAKASGIVMAAKLYPAGATTNSDFGVTEISKVGKALQAMSDSGMLLLVHGEVVDPTVDIFDKERIFIDSILRPLVAEFPLLKVVMEHITTKDAVRFVGTECAENSNIAATITAHHLLYNRNDIFRKGICPHMYCLPILKREEHRKALLSAATSGNPKFFIGTDSAPHAVGAKESACGCAGIFTGHAAIELYAEAFDSVGAIDKLEGFTSLFGPRFYGIPTNDQIAVSSSVSFTGDTAPTTAGEGTRKRKKLKLVKEAWIVPDTYAFGSSVLRPLRAGEAIQWKRVDL